MLLARLSEEGGKKKIGRKVEHEKCPVLFQSTRKRKEGLWAHCGGRSRGKQRRGEQVIGLF